MVREKKKFMHRVRRKERGRKKGAELERYRKLLLVFAFTSSLVLSYQLYGMLSNIFFHKNPYFLLDKYKIEVCHFGELSDGDLFKKQLNELLEAEADKGMAINLAPLNYKAFRRKIQALNPQVKSVQVIPSGNNGLKVTIVDKEPVARLSTRSGVLITSDGFITNSVPENLHLPVIIMIRKFKSNTLSHKTDNKDLLDALKLLNILSTSALGMKLDVGIIKCNRDETLSLILEGDGLIVQNCEIIVNRDQIKIDLARACLLIDERILEGKKTSYVNASIKSFVPVRPTYRVIQTQ